MQSLFSTSLALEHVINLMDWSWTPGTFASFTSSSSSSSSFFFPFLLFPFFSHDDSSESLPAAAAAASHKTASGRKAIEQRHAQHDTLAGLKERKRKERKYGGALARKLARVLLDHPEVAASRGVLEDDLYEVKLLKLRGLVLALDTQLKFRGCRNKSLAKAAKELGIVVLPLSEFRSSVGLLEETLADFQEACAEADALTLEDGLRRDPARHGMHQQKRHCRQTLNGVDVGCGKETSVFKILEARLHDDSLLVIDRDHHAGGQLAVAAHCLLRGEARPVAMQSTSSLKVLLQLLAGDDAAAAAGADDDAPSSSSPSPVKNNNKDNSNNNNKDKSKNNSLPTSAGSSSSKTSHGAASGTAKAPSPQPAVFCPPDRAATVRFEDALTDDLLRRAIAAGRQVKNLEGKKVSRSFVRWLARVLVDYYRRKPAALQRRK